MFKVAESVAKLIAAVWWTVLSLLAMFQLTEGVTCDLTLA